MLHFQNDLALKTLLPPLTDKMRLNKSMVTKQVLEWSLCNMKFMFHVTTVMILRSTYSPGSRNMRKCPGKAQECFV